MENKQEQEANRAALNSEELTLLEKTRQLDYYISAITMWRKAISQEDTKPEVSKSKPRKKNKTDTCQ